MKRNVHDSTCVVSSTMVLLLILVVVLVACGGAESTPTGDQAVRSPSDDTSTTQPPTTRLPTTSTQPTTAVPRPLDVAVGDWVLVDGQAGDELITMNPAAPITLTIEADQLTGSAGCNTYFTTRTAFDLPVGPIGSTRMACGPDIMSAESAYLEGLAAATEGGMDRTQLVLVGPGVELRFDPATSANATIEGTTWLLETYSELDSGIFSSADATLELVDGAVDGSTGCNRFTGTYELDGDMLVITDLAVTEIGCEPLIMDQEAAVLAVLFGNPSVVLEQLQLFVTSGDRSLIYRPQG